MKCLVLAKNETAAQNLRHYYMPCKLIEEISQHIRRINEKKSPKFINNLVNKNIVKKIQSFDLLEH